MSRHTRGWRACVLVAALSACASPRGPADVYRTEEGRRSLGRVAYLVTTGTAPAATRFATRNKWQGAALGMGQGVLACGQIVTGEPISVAIWLLISPVCAMVGTAIGAAQAAPADAVSALDATLQREIAERDAGAGLRHALAVHLEPSDAVRPLPTTFVTSVADGVPSYDDTVRALADTVLEAHLKRFTMASPARKSLKVRVEMVFRFRLVSVKDGGAVLDSFACTYAGPLFAIDAASDEALDQHIALAYRAALTHAGHRWPRIVPPVPGAKPARRVWTNDSWAVPCDRTIKT